MRTLIYIILIVLVCTIVPCLALAEDEQEETPVFSQGEVIVSGQRLPEETTSSMQEITEEEIRNLGAQNAADAIRIASGARVDLSPTSLSANGKAEQLVSLRGFDPRNVIVLIDGVPMYEPYFRVLDLSHIPVGDIAKIKIIKGPTSALYGPNALGGVINIITKRGIGKPKGRFESSYGTANSVKGKGTIYGSHKGFEYLGANEFSASDGYPISADYDITRNEDGGLRENSDTRTYYGAAKAGYYRGLHGLSASASHYQFDGGVPFSMEAAEPGTLWRKHWVKTSASLYGETGGGDFFHMKGRAFYTRLYNTITTYEDKHMRSVAQNGDAVSTYDNAVAGYILMPQFLLGKGGAFTLSGIYKRDMVNIQSEKGDPWYEYGAETYSGGGGYGVTISKVDLTASAAYNYYRRTDTPEPDLGEDNGAVDYQAGIAFRPAKFLELFTAGAHKSSFPDLKTLYGSYGNPDLKPEYAYNVDAGFRLRPASAFYLEATGFYSDVTDLIGKKEGNTDFTYENIDTATIAGIESLTRVNLFDGLFYASASYTYMETKDGRDDRKLKELDFRPKHAATLDGTLNLPTHTKISTQYYFQGERKYELSGGSHEIKTLPEYGIVNMRISQLAPLDDQGTALEVYVEGKNIGDVYFEQSPDKAAAGRMIFAGFGAKF